MVLEETTVIEGSMPELRFMTELEYKTANLNEWPAPSKIKVLLLSIHFPFAIKNYFENALRRREDVDLITCGPYTGTWTPWQGGMTLPKKYDRPPTIPMPVSPGVGRVPYEAVQVKLPQGWVPDIVLTIDAGISWTHKPRQGKVLHVATDAHVLNYDFQRTISDAFFNMHPHYSKPGDYLIHYAYDPEVHYPIKKSYSDGGAQLDPVLDREFDAVLIGLPYPQRVEWINELRRHGVTVAFENGPVFDEYREINNRARIGLNWSSMEDLNARVFELMAMKLCPVINRVPDLPALFPNGNYYGFDNLGEAVEQVLYAKNDPEEAQRTAELSYQDVRPYTYDALVEEMFKEAGF